MHAYMCIYIYIYTQICTIIGKVLSLEKAKFYTLLRNTESLQLTNSSNAHTIRFDFKKYNLALAAMAQLIEHQPADQRIKGSIPSQGHMPGLQARSPVRGVPGATTD